MRAPARWPAFRHARLLARLAACALACALCALVLEPAAAAREMRVLARITATDGMIHDAFALDESGARLGYVRTLPKGDVVFLVGPPGGKAKSLNLASFTASPEKVVAVGGSFFVVSSDGTRRAAVVTPAGRIVRELPPFGECLVSSAHGKALVTVTERGGTPSGGRAVGIVAYRPDGSTLAQTRVEIGPGGEIAGFPGMSFVGFAGGHLQVLVKRAGQYDRHADARAPAEFAVLDLVTRRAGPGKRLGDIQRFLDIEARRSEQPGVETFLRLGDDAAGLQLVGPAEKLRPLRLPRPFGLYEPRSLKQQMVGGKLVFSLAVDPLNADQVAAGRKGARSLHLFAADLGAASASLLGEIPLGETQDYAWSAGGSRIAVLKLTMEKGGSELVVFTR